MKSNEENNPVLTRVLLTMWLNEPVKYKTELWSTFRNSSFRIQSLVVEAWAKEPEQYRAELLEIYTTFPANNLKWMILEIWLKNPNQFRNELEDEFEKTSTYLRRLIVACRALQNELIRTTHDHDPLVRQIAEMFSEDGDTEETPALKRD